MRGRMIINSIQSPTTRARQLLAIPAMLVGIFAGATVWGSVGSWLEQPCSWMALLVAADLSLLMRLCAVPAGWMRSISAGVAFVITTLLSHFLMVSFIVAQWLGIDLMHSMSAIGPVLIWELGVAAGTIYDAAWLTLGLIITLWASK